MSADFYCSFFIYTNIFSSLSTRSNKVPQARLVLAEFHADEADDKDWLELGASISALDVFLCTALP